jgi:predicted Zn finger-like uncharacterized protein
MKFLCDRCKTRYSIADDRVRGKILKIRCKNCANVISVREGMTDEEPAAAPAPADRPALQDAFAKEMAPAAATAPPPPSLEEEWYVSIDGAQEGPYSLAAAQAWVASKKLNDDVHCWSEGFDDWLPVEKVSHFRGLRQRPVAPAPRGKPAIPTRAHTPTQPAPEPEAEFEPKPLFAATMAKLEAEASKVAPAPEPKAAPRPAKRDDSAPVAKAAPAPVARDDSKATKAPVAAPAPVVRDDSKATKAPVAAKRNGLGEVKPEASKPEASKPEAVKPEASKPEASKPEAVKPEPLADRAKAALPAPRAPIPLAALATPVAAPTATAATAGLAARVEARPAPIKPEPKAPARVPAARFDTGDADDGEPLDESALEAAHGEADKPAASSGTDNLDFDIGEVSRVVRLPDLAAMAAARAATGRAPAMRVATRSTGGNQAIGRGTGNNSAITMPASSLGDASAPTDLPPLSDSVLADAQPIGPAAAPPRSHAALWIVMGAAFVLVAVVVIAVVASSGGSNGMPISTGNNSYDNLGYTIDDPRAPRGSSDPNPGSGTAAVTPGSGTHIIRHPIGSNANPGSGSGPGTGSGSGSERVEVGADGQPILPLSGDDIVNVSSRNSIGTRRCYERALKDDPFLKVSKIMVSLKVDVAGVVTDVALDSHGTDKLGQCLIGAIRRWGFRRSTEGINTQFPLVFQQGF